MTFADFPFADAAAVAKGAERGRLLAGATALARDLADCPPVHLTRPAWPTSPSSWARTGARGADCPNAVTGYLMRTDNMPPGTAPTMGDVLTIRVGTTVEVLNADAEAGS